ncbi:MAG: Pantoate kinase [Candidatus Bathyarchaeota archaeon BA2]|nr:MAG: Pantoate kinase [Candidatus Bathyarchaeota archaeon BA2]
MKEFTAFSPGHITGLFQICDEAEEPLLKGSRGAGVSITRGVITKIRIEKAPKTSFEIRINGHGVKSAKVSECVINALLPVAEGNYRILVDHKVNVPIGSGFGSSGAGALSLALALNEAFRCGLSHVEAAQVVHIAEIKCKTGLGTVIAETFGGLEIREKPGAPGVGEVKHIPIDDDYVVACLKFGPMSTKEALTNERLRQRINDLGGKLVDELIARPKPANFMNFSRSFAEGVGLISKRMRKALEEADGKGITCSMTMFGECLFSLVRGDKAEELLEIFRRHTLSEDNIIVAEIDHEGARLL